LPAIDTAPFDPRETVPEDVRLHAIGDVHGCAFLLDRHHASIDAMQRAEPKARVVEILLGDMIDRGPDSKAVISRLIERSRHRFVIALRGNHEAMLMRFLNEPETLKEWIRYGGLETLRSYGVKPGLPLEPGNMVRTAQEAMEAIPSEHISFLRNLPLAWTCGGFTFVHAGLRPDVPLAEQAERDLMEIREPFLSHSGSFGTFVIHGHTPVKSIDVRPNRINVDTGAFATGNLSSIVIERTRIMAISTTEPLQATGAAAAPTAACGAAGALDGQFTVQAS